MKNAIIKKVIDFGKINYTGSGRRYPATVEIELRTCGGEPTFVIENGEKKPTGKTTPEYIELSICGNIWNTTKTDCYSCGQNLDEISKYIHTPEFKKIYTWWKKYHLNGMNAGTPEQTEIINNYFNTTGERYDYTTAKTVLEKAGKLTVNFTGKTIGREYNNEPYTYGTAWIIQDIPAADLEEIKAYLETK